MKLLFIHVVISTAGLFACLAAGIYIASLSDVVAIQSTGEGIGPFRLLPGLAAMAIFILLFSTYLRAWSRWPVADLLLGIVPVELMLFFFIGYASGLIGTEYFHWFNLKWFASVNLFLGLPWLVGLLLGSVLLSRKGKATPLQTQ